VAHGSHGRAGPVSPSARRLSRARPGIITAQRRTRLAVRHHLAPASAAATIEEAAHDQVGLHATDPTTVYLSALARIPGLDRATVERALYDDRTLVRMIGMRRTLFIEPIDLAPVVHVACAPSIVSRERRRLEGWLIDAGISETPRPWLAAVEDATVAAIERLGSGTAAELTKVVPELAIQIPVAIGKTYQGTVGVSTRVLFLLAMDGRISRGRPRGSWVSSQYRWESMHRWVDMEARSAALTEASAQADLVEGWLRAYGPATIDDLRWWTGWTVAAVRRALVSLATAEVDLDDGLTGVVMADDLETEKAPEPWISLLPSLDPSTMGWTARDWYLGAHRSALFDRSGNAGPTIWLDGRVVGGWGQRPDGEVVTRLLEDVGSEAASAIEARAAALTAWMDGVRIMPRFPTPLQRELSA
jgi:Winged helix DNA-binding domain